MKWLLLTFQVWNAERRKTKFARNELRYADKAKCSRELADMENARLSRLRIALKK